MDKNDLSSHPHDWSSNTNAKIFLINSIWKQLNHEDVDASIRGDLDRLCSQAVEAIAIKDITKAEYLTAYAAHLLTERTNI